MPVSLIAAMKAAEGHRLLADALNQAHTRALCNDPASVKDWLEIAESEAHATDLPKDHEMFGLIQRAIEAARLEGLAHVITERITPVAFVLRCKCGWSHAETRSQNALARASKVRAAKRRHLGLNK